MREGGVKGAASTPNSHKMLWLCTRLSLFSLLAQWSYGHGPEYVEQLSWERTATGRGVRGVGNETQGRRLKMSETRPIRIYVYAEDLSQDIADDDTRQYLLKDVIPAATRWLSLALRVPPVHGNLRFQQSCSSFWQGAHQDQCATIDPDYRSCGATEIPGHHFRERTFCPVTPSACEVSPGGDGISNADFALYVTAKDTAFCGGSTLAYASSCHQDELDRPVAGHMNICSPSTLSTAKSAWHTNIATVVHEILHALLFSASLFAFYRDANGEPRTARDWFGLPPLLPDNSAYRADANTIKEVVEAGGSKKHYLVLPEVLKVAREYYKCPSLDALPLEEEGGDGARYSHWDQRDFHSEVLTMEAENFPQVSPMTLAVAEASGWYEVDYAYAGAFYFGRNKGCAFFNDKCVNQGATAFPDTFCTNSDVTACGGPLSGPLACTPGRMGTALCSNCRHSTDLPEDFRYFGDARLGGSKASMAYCPIWSPFTTSGGEWSFCSTLPSDWQTKESSFGESFSAESRCIMSSVAKGSERSTFEGSCHEVRCDDQVVSIRVGSEWVQCPASGEEAEEQPSQSSGWRGRVQCPPAWEVCPHLPAGAGSCLFPGTVYEGRCVCAPGNLGDDCSKEDVEATRSICPFGLQYTQNTLQLVAGTAVESTSSLWSIPVRPHIVSGPTALRYIVTPKLPQGLLIDVDGTITGTPAVPTRQAQYIVYAEATVERSSCNATTTLIIDVACPEDSASNCQLQPAATDGISAVMNASAGDIGQLTLSRGQISLMQITLVGVRLQAVQEELGISQFIAGFESTMLEILGSTVVVLYVLEQKSGFTLVESTAPGYGPSNNQALTSLADDLMSILEADNQQLQRTSFGAQYLRNIELVTITSTGISKLWPTHNDGYMQVSCADRRHGGFSVMAALFLVLAVF